MLLMVGVQVPMHALKTPFKDGTVLDLAKRMVQLSREGLQRRGKSEESFLVPLQEIVDVSHWSYARWQSMGEERMLACLCPTFNLHPVCVHACAAQWH